MDGNGISLGHNGAVGVEVARRKRIATVGPQALLLPHNLPLCHRREWQKNLR
jgi:hypothetical protein